MGKHEFYHTTCSELILHKRICPTSPSCNFKSEYMVSYVMSRDRQGVLFFVCNYIHPPAHKWTALFQLACPFMRVFQTFSSGLSIFGSQSFLFEKYFPNKKLSCPC